MNKKLIAKAQFLNPSLPEEAGGFAKAIGVEPESEDTRLKRGTIYTIFNVNGGSGYDTELITKVVHDILHNSYFQSDNISPIQSLEKAIADVKDKIAHLTNETIRTDDTPTGFSIIAGALWGNVMYVVQYGAAQGYLVREGDIKPINTITEGGFSAASGVIRDGDVMILCSHEFGKKYPPNKLMSMSIGEQQLMPEEACILLKFIVDTSFSSNEQIDFGLPENVYKKERKPLLGSLTGAITKLKGKRAAKATVTTPAAAPTPPSSQMPPMQQVTSISTDAPQSKTKGIKLRRSSGKSILKNPAALTIIIALMLGTSIFFSMRNKQQPEQNVEQTQQQEEAIKPVVEGVEKKAEEPDEEVFYDIKIAEPTAQPNALAVFNTVVVVSDNTSGKIYVSDQTTAKFEPEESFYVGIKNIVNIGGKLGFTDNEGYKVYDLANEKLVESYKKTDLSVTSSYLSYVYAVEGDKITRYSKATDALEGTLWGQSAEFTGAKSISVAYSIYLVTADGKINKYTSGDKDTFALEGDAEKIKLNNPTQVVADLDFENIYVVDTGNQRIVSFDKKGNFVKEYKPKKQGAWNDLKSVGITPDEKTMYVLNGSRVYKIAL